MSTTQIGIIIGVLVLGGVGFVVMQSDDGADLSATGGSEVEETDSSQDGPSGLSGSGSASFAELIERGDDMQCDFSYSDETSGGNVSGTMYVTDEGKRFRGDFTMNQNGQTFESHIIRDNATAYTWGETPYGTMGTTFQINEPDDISEAEGLSSDQEVEYSCSGWSVDQQFFVPPSDVEFTDMTQQLDGLEQSGGDMKEMQCEACNQLQDPQQREQCRQALQCEA